MKPQELEQSFINAYRQKYLELLEKNTSSLSEGEKANICKSLCNSNQNQVLPTDKPQTSANSSVGAKSLKLLRSIIVFIIIAFILGIAFVFLYKSKKNILGNGNMMKDIESTLTGDSDISIKKGVNIMKTGSAIPTKGKHVVMLHHPDCGHCKTTIPLIKNVIKNIDSCEVHLCDAECGQNLPTDQKNQFKLQGYPTFISFIDGKKHKEHVGGLRNEDDCENMIKKLVV